MNHLIDELRVAILSLDQQKITSLINNIKAEQIDALLRAKENDKTLLDYVSLHENKILFITVAKLGVYSPSKRSRIYFAGKSPKQIKQ